NTGVLDLSKIGGRTGPAQGGTREGSRHGRILIRIGVITAVIALGVAGFGISRWLPSQPANTSEEHIVTAEPSHQDSASVGTEAQRVHTQRRPVQQPGMSPSTQGAATAPPIQMRGEVPVRVPPLSGSALPEMVRIPGRNFEVGRYEVTIAQW